MPLGTGSKAAGRVREIIHVGLGVWVGKGLRSHWERQGTPADGEGINMKRGKREERWKQMISAPGSLKAAALLSVCGRVFFVFLVFFFLRWEAWRQEGKRETRRE